MTAVPEHVQLNIAYLFQHDLRAVQGDRPVIAATWATWIA
jgi:hypothetical protein